MYGAIFGDIVGSKYEFSNIKTKDFDLYAQDVFFTDDTVLTVAVAHAILDCTGNYDNLSKYTVKRIRRYGNNFPDSGFGTRFKNWLIREDTGAFNSCGNGAAMRVSPVGWIAKSIEECFDLSEKVTVVTHNHIEGLKGAEATAACIFWARQKWTKQQIFEYVVDNYYDLDTSVDEIRKNKKHFDAVCQETVPQAIICFLESTDFEDCIKNAISIGGDSDTLAAIAGSIAEAYYGMPQKAIDFVNNFITDSFKDVIDKFKLALHI